MTELSSIKKLWNVHKTVSVSKDKKGYNYTYATLKEVQQQLDPVLESEGLVYDYVSRVDNCGNEPVNVFTLNVYDTDTGELVKQAEKAYPVSADAQVGGSQDTYSRRYLLLTAFNLLPAEKEDDDGEKTKGTTTRRSRRRTA